MKTGTHTAPVSLYYKSHVSSECITLQQESLPPTLQGQIDIYSSRMMLGFDPNYVRITQHSPEFVDFPLFTTVLSFHSVSWFLQL